MKATYNPQSPDGKSKLKEKQELQAQISEAVNQRLNNKKRKSSWVSVPWLTAENPVQIFIC